MATPVPLTFLGTGGFHATAGYWSSFLIGDRILVESSPSVLRNLRVAGKRLDDVDVIFISHFHADHTFGWPNVSTIRHPEGGQPPSSQSFPTGGCNVYESRPSLLRRLPAQRWTSSSPTVALAVNPCVSGEFSGMVLTLTSRVPERDRETDYEADSFCS